jgi:hypothetical protein
METLEKHKNILITEINTLFHKVKSLDTDNVVILDGRNVLGIKTLKYGNDYKPFFIISLFRNDTPNEDSVLDHLSYVANGIYEPITNLSIESLYNIYDMLSYMSIKKEQLVKYINELFDVSVKINDNNYRYLDLKVDELGIRIAGEIKNIHHIVRYGDTELKLVIKIPGLNVDVPWVVSTESISLSQLEDLSFFFQRKFYVAK